MINKMNKHRKQMAEEFLSQALGIICLLTGEEYVIVKKRHSHNTIHRQSREVPIKCDDVAVYSSMEEWEYIEGHKELYKDVMMETHQTLSTMAISENKSSELTGHSDENLDTGAHGEFLQNIQPVETPSDVAADVTGHSDENLDVGVRGEFVQNIELVETSSDVTAGDIDVKTEDLSVTCQLEAPMQEMCDSDNEDKNDVKISCNTEQTENQWLRNITEAAEKEILQNNSTGAVKTEVTLNAEQTYDLYVKNQLEVLKQEIGDNINTGEFTNCNNPRHGQNPDASFGLLQNQSSHMGNVCSECGKSFTWKSKLITHQKIHTGVKAFPCPECGKCFSLKSTLTNHLKIHTGEKAFPCSECGKCFTLKSNLVAHQKTHTGEKAFSCSECGKWFVQKSNLITHQKTHTGEKEFSCSECGKCFARKATLFDHQKTHTKERAFLCTECGKSFTQKSTLITHKKIHIKGKSNSNILSAEDIDYMLSSWSRSFGANPGPPCTLSSYKEAQYVQNHYHQGI